MVMLIKVRASSMTCCGSAEVKGDGDGMVGDKRAGMVVFLSRWSRCRAGKWMD
jgi:hypothetical protein